MDGDVVAVVALHYFIAVDDDVVVLNPSKGHKSTCVQQCSGDRGLRAVRHLDWVSTWLHCTEEFL